MFHVQLLTVMRREVSLTARIHEVLLTSEALLTSWFLLKTVVSDFVFVCHLHNRVTTVSSKSYARFFLRLGSHFTESCLL